MLRRASIGALFLILGLLALSLLNGPTTLIQLANDIFTVPENRETAAIAYFSETCFRQNEA